MMAVLRRRWAADPRPQQVPIQAVRLRRVTGQRPVHPLGVRPAVARPTHRVLVKLGRKAAVRRRPAAKRRSLAMTVNRAAARKRIQPVVRREQAVPPASRARAIPLKAREARAPVRMPVAARVKVARRLATAVRQRRLPVVRQAAPTVVLRPRCQPVCPALPAAPWDPMPAVEARAPHREKQVVRVKLAARLPAVQRAAVPVLVLVPETVELPAARPAAGR